jgi:hypothetical protein
MTVQPELFSQRHYLMLMNVIVAAVTNAGKLNIKFGNYLIWLRDGSIIENYSDIDVLNDLIEAEYIFTMEYGNGSTRYIPTDKGMLMFQRVVNTVVEAWTAYEPVSKAYDKVLPLKKFVRKPVSKRVGPIALDNEEKP